LARERLGFTKIDYRNNTVFDIESYFKTTEQWDEELVFLKNAGIRIVEGQHTNIETKKSTPVEITVVYKELDGEPYTIATTKDISRRKETEAKLVETNRFLEVLNSAIDSSSLVSETDLNGVISYVNEKFCELSQYTAQELIGQKHSIINCGSL
jgi:PAS domain-containing protein